MPSTRGVAISFSHSFISFIHSLNIGRWMQVKPRMGVTCTGTSTYVRPITVPRSVSYSAASIINITAVC